MWKLFNMALIFVGAIMSQVSCSNVSHKNKNDINIDTPIKCEENTGNLKNKNYQIIEHEGIAYKIVDDDEVEVTSLPGKKKYAGHVTIPASITLGGTNPFLDNVGKSSIADGKESGFKEYSVVAIGKCAFKDCKDLIKLELPDELREIGCEAVAGCTSLLEIKMPNKIGKIGDSAFERSQFRTLAINGSVGEMGDRVFYGVNAGYIKLNHCELPAFGKETFTNSTLKRIYLPPGLKTIPSNTFSGCDKLMYVHFGNGLEEIGAEAFKGCGDLKALSLPSTLTRIGKDAFSGVQVESIAFERNTAPAFKMESICGKSLPSLVAFPGEGEISYRNWCPEMYSRKYLLTVKNFSCIWLYRGIIKSEDEDEVKMSLKYGVAGYESNNIKLLIDKGENISLIYPMMFGASYDTILTDDNKTSKKLEGCRLYDSPMAKYFSDENYVLIPNIEGNYLIERIQTDEYLKTVLGRQRPH